METVLSLLKIDLGITHTLRDTFFTALLQSSQIEIEGRGIVLVLTDIEDQMLLSDYAAWKYRKRQEDVGMSQNLSSRIRNRIVKARSAYVTTYAVVFLVTNGVTGVAGAIVTVGDITGTTLIGGIATLQVPNGIYTYTVESAGNVTVTGTITVGDVTISETVVVVAA